MLRVGEWLKFRLEKLLLRGLHMRLLLMMAAVGLMAVAGGLAVGAFDPDGSFAHPGESIWWAFLRLSDPGYLGDDHGAWKRAVSTVLTVAGYVLFMGSLVAVMTQWLNQTLSGLELGLTPIAKKGHVLVLGWTTRTPVIVRELLATADRVERFLALRNVRSLHLVLLVEHLDAELRQTLRHFLGRHWKEPRLTMRSGTPLHVDHLHRVDFRRASAILVPSEDVGPDEEQSDARTIKTLLSIARHSRDLPKEELPLVVTEIFDSRKVSVAKHAYAGPLEVVATDQLVGRLLALTVLYPHMSRVFEEMLVYGDGSELHVREVPELEGERFSELRRWFPHAVVLGWVRFDLNASRYKATICPAQDEILAEGDRLVLLAPTPEDTEPEGQALRPVTAPDLTADAAIPSHEVERVLVLGWSDRVPDLIIELMEHHRGGFSVDVASAVSVEKREAVLGPHTIRPGVVRNLLADAADPVVVDGLVGDGYDRIVLIASDWLQTGAQSDARTLLTLLLVSDALARAASPRAASISVELMHRSSRELIDDPELQLLVSPAVVGRIMAHVALRRELESVYDELLNARGSVLSLRSPQTYGISDEKIRFDQLEEIVASHGDVLLGVMGDERRRPLKLNPPKATHLSMHDGTELVVVTATSPPVSSRGS